MCHSNSLQIISMSKSNSILQVHLHLMHNQHHHLTVSSSTFAPHKYICTLQEHQHLVVCVLGGGGGAGKETVPSTMQCTRLQRLHHYSAQTVATTTGLMRSNTRGHYLCHCVSVVNCHGPVEICAVRLCRTSLHFLAACYMGCLHLAYTHSTHLVHIMYTPGAHTWSTHMVHIWYTQGTYCTTPGKHGVHTQHTCGTCVVHT